MFFIKLTSILLASSALPYLSLVLLVNPKAPSIQPLIPANFPDPAIIKANSITLRLLNHL